jgi:sugar/nucleoside kinase (ribokinase family)
MMKELKYKGMFAGLTTIDIQYFVESFPASNKKIKTGPPDLLIGGPATNAAVAFAALNGEAILASATGKNHFTNFIREDLIMNSIVHYDFIPSVAKNPILATVITSKNNGDRNIFTHHPEEITPEVTAADIAVLVEPNIFMIDGFYPETVTEAAKICKLKGIPVVMDCGSWKPQYDILLDLTDVAICSSDFLPPGCNGSEEVFSYLRQKGVKMSAISRGGQSLLFQQGEGRGLVPVLQADIKDTLGAGDFLHGAFCYYYLHSGYDFEGALQLAAALATFSCKFNGTRQWILSLKPSSLSK